MNSHIQPILNRFKVLYPKLTDLSTPNISIQEQIKICMNIAKSEALSITIVSDMNY
jgi:hypothetical protein